MIINTILTESEYVGLTVRIGPTFSAERSGLPPGYTYQIQSNSSWYLWKGYQTKQATLLTSGKISFTCNYWHSISISVKENNLKVTFDGADLIPSGFDDDEYTAGQ